MLLGDAALFHEPGASIRNLTNGRNASSLILATREDVRNSGFIIIRALFFGDGPVI
jgi:hypothetical protein